jgi:hypothetical protein
MKAKNKDYCSYDVPEEIGPVEEFIPEKQEENIFYPVPAEEISLEYFSKKASPEIRYESDFLPILKLDHKTFEIVMVDEPAIVPPICLVCLGIRNMSRKLVGSKYEDRCYEGGATHEKYMHEMAEENGAAFGLSALVYISCPSVEKIAGLEIFGTSGQVWSKWLEGTSIHRDKGKKTRRLERSGYMDCSGESDRGRFIKPGKVPRGELIQIEDKGISKILQQAEKQKKQVEHFFNR